MAEVVNTSQQVISAGIRPRAHYTRLLSTFAQVLGDGVWVYQTTEAVGQQTWLLGVDIWVMQKAINLQQMTMIQLKTGQGIPTTIATMQTWQDLFPIQAVTAPFSDWLITDGTAHLRLNVCRIFKGTARRFGFLALRDIGTGLDRVYVTFEISEG